MESSRYRIFEADKKNEIDNTSSDFYNSEGINMTAQCCWGCHKSNYRRVPNKICSDAVPKLSQTYLAFLYCNFLLCANILYTHLRKAHLFWWDFQIHNMFYHWKKERTRGLFRTIRNAPVVSNTPSRWASLRAANFSLQAKGRWHFTAVMRLNKD